MFIEDEKKKDNLYTVYTSNYNQSLPPPPHTSSNFLNLHSHGLNFTCLS